MASFGAPPCLGWVVFVVIDIHISIAIVIRRGQTCSNLVSLLPSHELQEGGLVLEIILASFHVPACKVLSYLEEECSEEPSSLSSPRDLMPVRWVLEELPSFLDRLHQLLALPPCSTSTSSKDNHEASIANRTAYIALFSIQHAVLMLPCTALLTQNVVVNLGGACARPVATKLGGEMLEFHPVLCCCLRSN